MADSVSLEQLNEQQKQLMQTVNNLIAQKAQLEDQLENTKATLASNNGALQYANSLIQQITEGQDDVGIANVSEEIKAEPADPVEVVEAEEVQL
jgi:flagellar biosynthesis/type III secretory pathway protein FliH|tara:strand:+ start:350 stop:631 length:282 start_codon:yes stop_codon:yes gene_type:complete